MYKLLFGHQFSTPWHCILFSVDLGPKMAEEKHNSKSYNTIFLKKNSSKKYNHLKVDWTINSKLKLNYIGKKVKFSNFKR
jgi:hypothetical protein